MQRKLAKAQRRQEKAKLQEHEKWLETIWLEAKASAAEAEEVQEKDLTRAVSEKKKEGKERRRKEAQGMGFVLSEKKKDESAENDLKKSKENIIALVSNIREVRILLTFPKLSLKKQYLRN